MCSEDNREESFEKEFMYLEGYMPKEEVKRLAKLAQQGDRKAEEALILGHLRLVNLLIQKYRDRGIPYEDLFQEGCIALIQAVKNYDYNRDTLLSSYASYYIIRNIQRALMKAEPIQKPEAMYLEIKRYQYIKNALHIEYSREPTDEEIAAQMGVTSAHITKLKNRIYQYVSLDALSRVSNDSCKPIGNSEIHLITGSQDYQEPVDIQVFRKLGLIDFRGSEKLLTKKEQKVLSLRFNQKSGKMTFKDIARTIGCSTEGARLTYIQAVEKLSQHMKTK